MNQLIERAILVGLRMPNDDLFDHSMEELYQLAEANHIEVVTHLVQQADAPTPDFFIGSGKVGELKALYESMEANLIIFNDELSPVHIRNLEKQLQAKVIDRTILILDIFVKRARTKEAMLQVALAQHQYMLPRIIGLHQSLSRQKSGTGSKGPGEQQIELDRRRLKDEITRIRKELKVLVEQRRVQRVRRKKNEQFTIAIAGYTNAGKSTLMNRLLSLSVRDPLKEVFVKDMPFATLETSTRLVELPNTHRFLLTDTVGFISKLPHHLIEAFKSTLEEIQEADLILHVLDGSDPYHDVHLNVAEQVLSEIGVQDIPVIYVMNKCDKTAYDVFLQQQPNVSISALTGQGIDQLLLKIEEFLSPLYTTLQLYIPFEQARDRALLYEQGVVTKHDEDDRGEIFEVHVHRSLAHQWVRYRRDIQ